MNISKIHQPLLPQFLDSNIPYEAVEITLFSVRASIYSYLPKVLEYVRFDFGSYVSDRVTDSCDISVYILAQPPAFTASDEIGRFSSGVKYRTAEGFIYLEYRDGIGCLWCSKKEQAIFFPTSSPGQIADDYLYEQLYLFLSSRLGELTERRGIKRVHGLSIAIGRKAVLGLSPSGGGKSTLTRELIKNERVALFSDDSPFLVCDPAHGTIAVAPYKTRVGIRVEDSSGGALGANQRIFKRKNRQDKIVLSPYAPELRWCEEHTVLTDIVSLRFTKNGMSRLARLSKVQGFILLARDLVIGYGLPQVVEFFLKNGVASVTRQSPLFFGRLWTAIRLCRQCRFWVLHQNGDVEENAKLFVSILDKP